MARQQLSVYALLGAEQRRGGLAVVYFLAAVVFTSWSAIPLPYYDSSTAAALGCFNQAHESRYGD